MGAVVLGMVAMIVVRLLLSSVLLLAVPAGNAQANSAVPASQNSARAGVETAAPPRMFAPYVDMGKPFNNLPQIQAASGIKRFTLAFVIAGDGCTPAWGGRTPVAGETVIAGYIDKLRESGGDVIIAFGGYDGMELAQTCNDVPSLQAAYQSVIDRYHAKIVDFDIEHTAIEDPVSIDRRSLALKALAAS